MLGIKGLAHVALDKAKKSIQGGEGTKQAEPTTQNFASDGATNSNSLTIH